MSKGRYSYLSPLDFGSRFIELLWLARSSAWADVWGEREKQCKRKYGWEGVMIRMDREGNWQLGNDDEEYDQRVDNLLLKRYLPIRLG